MSPHVLQEINKQAVDIQKNDDINLVWRNSALAVRTAKAIYIYEFSYDLKCMDKKLDFVESMLQIPKSSPVSYLVSNNFISCGVSNFELSQLIVDPSLWAHSPAILQEMACAIDCKWSPQDFYFQHEPLLAVLNNIGNVNIIGKQNGTWSNILDLSSSVNKVFNLELPICVEDLKTKADIVFTSALCWAANPNTDGSCFVVFGQKNGNILLWSLNGETKLKAVYRGCIKKDSGEIKSIMCINTNGKFILVFSNIFGQVILCECKISKTIEMLETHLIWAYKDKIVTQYLYHTEVNNKSIICFDKNRHLVVQLLDDKYKVKSQYADVVNDYRISSITVNLHKIYVGTVNLQLYKVNIDVSNDLDVRLDLIKVKDTYNNGELFGMSLSKNSQIFAAIIVYRSVICRKKLQNADIIFFSTDSGYDSHLSVLMQSGENNIFYLWDTIELLRYKILKLRTLPKAQLNQLLADGETDIFKLKLYLLIANVWCTLENNLKVPIGLLPENIDNVKEKLMLKHAQSQLHALSRRNDVNHFEEEIFIATKKYIQYYSQKYNVKLEDLVSKAVFNSVQTEIKYMCQCCENEMELFSCSNGHINMFCPITFTPIETNNYLICVICKITARIELYDNRTKCIFCDRCLQKHL